MPAPCKIVTACCLCAMAVGWALVPALARARGDMGDLGAIMAGATLVIAVPLGFAVARWSEHRHRARHGPEPWERPGDQG